MAGIDSSIYFQQQTADPFGSFEKGMRLGDMIKQRRNEGEIQDAYKAGMIQNPDGTYKQDMGVTLGQLAKDGHMKEYNSLAQQQKEQQAAAAKQQRELQAQNAVEIGKMAGAALQNPNAWPQIRAEAIRLKYGTEQTIPQQYDPKFLESTRYNAMSVAEQYAAEEKKATQSLNIDKFELEKKKFDEEKRKNRETSGKKAGLTEGMKALDKDFAKDQNDWTSGAADRSKNEITKLKGVVERLKANKGTTGGMTGMFGDRLTSNDVLQNRADVQQSAMSLIKQLLSGATSDTDRKAIVDTLWNEADSTENNITRIERFIEDYQARVDAMDAKTKHFENSGSLSGYKSQKPQQRIPGLSDAKSYSPPVVNGNEIEWK